MKRSPIAAARLVALGLFLFVLGPPHGLAQECLDCHGEPGSYVELKTGESRDVTVDPKAWEGSVHGAAGLDCTVCHSDIEEYPHPELADASSRDLTLRLYTSCQQCHEEQYKKTLDSVHQRALAAGDKNAAICADCHDPHVQKKITAEDGTLLPEGRLGIPQTCARCHAAIQEQYSESVHGAALVDHNGDVPTCIDCHGVHDIHDPTTASFRLASPRMCADCHTDPRKMAKYNLSTEVLRTYVADFHGSTVTLFQRRHPDQMTNKPVCYDCHGIHDIASKSDPRKSLLVKENLLATCQKCHPQASTNFPDAWLSHYVPTRERNPIVYWARRVYWVLIPGVIGAMGVFVATDVVRRRIDRRRRRHRSGASMSILDQLAQPLTYARFSLSDRLQHAVMAISFLVLTVTGLPQKYIIVNSHFLDDVIELLGGIESVRVIHRWAATVLMIVTVYHVLDVAYRILVRRVSLSMLPRFMDAVDALRAFRYNLGLAKQRPRMDRYTWDEKVEYWSLVWGTVVMIVTGFMLWNPVATARFLPGQSIPAAQVVHGGEALLAILAVLVWHFYCVHLRHFNRSMFSGRMTEHEMAEEHPVELERILAGQAEATADHESLARRRRAFLPVACVVAVLLLAGVYWFVTFEQTAIETLPPR